MLSSPWWLKEKTEKIIKYIAFFLSAVQMISLVTLVMVNRLNDNANHGFSKEGEFTIGSEENIVVIILDTLKSSSLKENLVTDSYAAVSYKHMKLPTILRV